MTRPKIARTKIHLSVATSTIERMKEMQQFWGLNNSMVVQKAVDFCYEDLYLRKKGGYFAGSNTLGKQSSKSRKENFLDRLALADDAEATKMLLDIGYIEAPNERADNPGVVNEFKVEGGALKRYITQTWLPGKAPDVTIVWPNKEELIAAVKNDIKQGRLKIKE